MKDQHTEQRQIKIIQLQTSKKKNAAISTNTIVTVLLFGLFISLSVLNNQLFLKEILITTVVIGMALASKATSNVNK